MADKHKKDPCLKCGHERMVMFNGKLLRVCIEHNDECYCECVFVGDSPDQEMPWCEPCKSWHVIPLSKFHKDLLQCKAPDEIKRIWVSEPSLEKAKKDGVGNFFPNFTGNPVGFNLIEFVRVDQTSGRVSVSPESADAQVDGMQHEGDKSETSGHPLRPAQQQLKEDTFSQNDSLSGNQEQVPEWREKWLAFWFSLDDGDKDLLKGAFGAGWNARADSVSPSTELKDEKLAHELTAKLAERYLKDADKDVSELIAERDSLRAALKSCLQQMRSAAGLLEMFPDDYGEAINQAAALLGEQAGKNSGGE